MTEQKAKTEYVCYNDLSEDDKALCHDPDMIKRMTQAKVGHGLDKLINDEDWHVRCTVAEQGYGLPTLAKDSEWIVRQTVVEQGYITKELAQDCNPMVRRAVAEQNKALDKLIFDPDTFVKERSKGRLGIALTNDPVLIDAAINEWTQANPTATFEALPTQIPTQRTNRPTIPGAKVIEKPSAAQDRRAMGEASRAQSQSVLRQPQAPKR